MSGENARMIREILKENYSVVYAELFLYISMSEDVMLTKVLSPLH
jgi:hypothetical protein